MNSRISRRALLGGIGAAALSGPALADAPLTSLRPVMRGGAAATVPAGPDALVAAAGLKGEVAFAVADVATGATLESLTGQKGLPPASVAKALTALYALDVLGSDHRFETRLIAEGAVENGILQGDLVLAGGGDPTLDTEALAALARGLKQAGIREVRGDFRVYDGALPYVRSIDGDQPDHLGYSPAISGIALNFNRVHFEWKRAGSGYSVSMEARTANYRPAVDTASMQVIKRQVPVYTYEEQGGVDAWTVARGALGNGGSRWLPVRKPGLYAGDVFRTLARSHGIVLKTEKLSRLRPQGTVIAAHSSQPLIDIVRDMLKYSTNITAEMVGMMASAKRRQTPVNLRHSAREMNRWAGETLNMRSTAMVDHSGLGDASRMTPSDLVRALVRARKDGVLQELLKPFPMRDAQGRTVKSHAIRVAAKTGTLNFVSGLGGYMTAPDGRELAFAIFTADTERRARIARADRERPDGAREWNRRSRQLQQKLIERWGTLNGS